MPSTIADPSDPVQAHVESQSLFYVWDVATLRWVRGIQPSASGVTGDMNLVEIVGATPSATNPLPVRLTNGTSFDPTLTVTGPLTDSQLRASAVPVSGPLTDTQLRATAVPVSGPLTDTQLRATAVPVSGPLTDSQLRASSVNVALKDIHGKEGEFNQVRELNVDQPYRVAGTLFVGTTVDTNFWTSTVSGAGAANTQATNLVTTASGTTNSGYAQFQSVRKGRFIFAHPLVVRLAVRLTATTVALNTRRWGAFTTSVAPTPTDGFYFEQSAAGVLSVVCSNGGTPNSVASGSFNGEVSTYTMDTNVHAFEIHYFVMQAQFYIDDVLIHTFTPTTANLSGDFTLPICWNSVNTAAGVTSGVIEGWAAVIRRMGRDVTQPTSFRQSGTTAGQVLKRGPGALRSLSISNVSINSAITLYDNTAASGTVIWSSGTLPALTQPFDIDLHDVQFQTGLDLVIATAASDVVVIYE